MARQPAWIQERAISLRRSMTPPEALLWERLRKFRMDGVVFRRQEPLLSRFVVDFVCFAAKVVIEVDGLWVHMDRGDADIERKEALEAAGFVVFSYPASEVMDNPFEIAEAVASVCKERMSRD